MSNQRPAWFRLSSLATRPPVPAPAPARPPPPPSAPVRPPAQPEFQMRPPMPPPQNQQPAPLTSPLPPAPRAPVTAPTPPQKPTPATPPGPSPIATSPRPTPVATPAAPPRSSPVSTRASPPPAATPTPPRSPSAPPAIAATAQRSPVVPPPAAAATPSRSPVLTPATQPSPPRALSQIDTPPPKSTTPSKSPVTNSQQSSPKTRNQTASSSSPTHKPVATPISSPKPIKPNSENSPPSQSPIIKPLSHPPSPMTQPLPQIRTDAERGPEEQKNVLVHEPIHKPTTKTHIPHNYGGNIASKGKKEPMKMHNPRTSKKVSDSKDFGMRVIMLAGENRGAIMELKPPHKKSNSNYKNATVGNSSSTENGEDGKISKNKDKNDKTANVQPPMTSFSNSNVQGVNNSILYNTNCRHNDPGIHLSLGKKPNGDRNHRG